jgi:hypothetical protein
MSTHTCSYLQTAAVDDLVVDRELTTLIRNDKNANAATTIVEGICEAAEETALVKDGKTLLDITSLGHGNDTTVIADVQHAVLLEDRSDHVLNNHRWAGIADEGRLLVKLLAEEVHTEVAVLASLSRSSDADDLAWAALKDEEVTDADVVAWDGDGVGRTGRAVRATLFGVPWSAHGDFAVSDNDVFFTINADVFVSVVARSFKWATNLFGGLVETVTEAVVVAVFVVISHVAVVLFRAFFLEANGLTLGRTVGWILAWVSGLVLPLSLLYERSRTSTEVSLGGVNARVEVFPVVITVLNVDLSVGVTLKGLAVAVKMPQRQYSSSQSR